MTEPILKSIETIIRSALTCVLATTGPDAPHTSLMAYVVDPDCRTLYLVTPRQTAKYQNMIKNPGVSILIDNRCNDLLQNIRALTVSGTALEVKDAETRRTVRDLFFAKYTELTEIVDASSSAFISVSIHSFQLLRGIRESSFIRLDQFGEPDIGTGR